jgi:hypothetical protein
VTENNSAGASCDGELITSRLIERRKAGTGAYFVRWAVLALMAVLSVGGCEKQSGEAIVLAKEHIAAAEPSTATPAAEPETSSGQPFDASTVQKSLRPMGDNEIAVDQYVMKAELRGTGRDPRALPAEQWLVKVRMINNGRTLNVPADQAKFEKLQEGDRVQVRYRLGKYSRKVWAAEIDTK